MLIKIFEKLSKECTMYPRKKDSAEKLMMVSKYSDLSDPTLADNWVVWHEGQQLKVTFRDCAVEKV